MQLPKLTNLDFSIFLVDGPSDKYALSAKIRNEYSSSPDFRHVGCNGKNVQPSAYANAALGLVLDALRGSYRQIVCILDRESRRISASNLAIEVKNSLIEKILESSKYKKKELTNKIIVCVADKMFENWIIADIEGIKILADLISDSASQDYYDGKNGAKILKEIMIVPYKKTIHCSSLFEKVRCRSAIKYSPSFLNITKSLKL